MVVGVVVTRSMATRVGGWRVAMVVMVEYMVVMVTSMVEICWWCQ